jgi:hypothetical protein
LINPELVIKRAQKLQIQVIEGKALPPDSVIKINGLGLDS